jgi:hypothetical protein
MGTVEDWPVAVSILTQYGDSDCCVSGVMRHPLAGATKVAGKILSILARPAAPCAIRWVATREAPAVIAVRINRQLAFGVFVLSVVRLRALLNQARDLLYIVVALALTVRFYLLVMARARESTAKPRRSKEPNC